MILFYSIPNEVVQTKTDIRMKVLNAKQIYETAENWVQAPYFLYLFLLRMGKDTKDQRRKSNRPAPMNPENNSDQQRKVQPLKDNQQLITGCLIRKHHLQKNLLNIRPFINNQSVKNQQQILKSYPLPQSPPSRTLVTSKYLPNEQKKDLLNKVETLEEQVNSLKKVIKSIDLHSIMRKRTNDNYVLNQMQNQIDKLRECVDRSEREKIELRNQLRRVKSQVGKVSYQYARLQKGVPYLNKNKLTIEKTNATLAQNLIRFSKNAQKLKKQPVDDTRRTKMRFSRLGEKPRTLKLNESDINLINVSGRSESQLN